MLKVTTLTSAVSPLSDRSTRVIGIEGGKGPGMEQACGPGQAAMREALRLAAATLSGAGVPWALAGGYALFAFGAPEPTHDVDIVIEPESADRVAEQLADGGFRIEHPVEDWLFKACWDGGDEPAMVDVIHRLAGRTVDHTLLAGSCTRQLLAIDMPILSPDVALWAKLAVLDEQDCDFTPLLPVARAVREQVDWTVLRRNLADNPFATSFLDLLIRLQVVAG
jgi:hypothetical protein